MKKHFLIWMIAVFVLFLPSACAENISQSELEALAQQYEPGPYGDVSYQEKTPFQPVSISPEAFRRAVADCETPEETVAYLQKLELPMDVLDEEYVFAYRNRLSTESFSLADDARITAVSYAYSEDENDNCVFLFRTDGDGSQLMDCIFNFGGLRLVEDGSNA